MLTLHIKCAYFTIASVMLVCLSGSIAQAQVIDETTLSPAHGIVQSQFGSAIATSNNTLVVGAPRYNKNTGAAYLYTLDPASNGGWKPGYSLPIPGLAQGDLYGAAVAIEGSTVAIGAPNSNGGHGAVYVFILPASPQGALQTYTLQGGIGDQFGSAIALVGNTLAVGSPGHNLRAGSVTTFAFTPGVPAGKWNVTGNFSDNIAGDRFGASLALSSKYLVVGAPGNNSGRGIAYLYQTGISRPAMPLTGADSQAGDGFGSALSVQADTVIVGAPNKASKTGGTYSFLWNGAQWNQSVAPLPANAKPGSAFGAAVLLSGSTLYVSSTHTATGSITLYTPIPGGWNLESTVNGPQIGGNFGASLASANGAFVAGAPGVGALNGAVVTGSIRGSEFPASQGSNSEKFGKAVAVSGNTIAVGSPEQYDGAGAVTIYTLVNGSWSQQTQFTPADAIIGGNFGASVAVWGDTVAVGAPYDGFSANGSVYIYKTANGAWYQQAKFSSSASGFAAGFGRRVALQGGTLVVSAPNENNSAGTVYVYTLGPLGWAQQKSFTGGAANDQFGSALALSTTNLVVGAPGWFKNTGGVYIYPIVNGQFQPSAAITNGVPGSNFGASVTLIGSSVVVGAPYLPGTATVYSLVGSHWTATAMFSSLTPQDYFGYSLAAYGNNLVVGAPGTLNSAGAAFVFTYQKGVAPGTGVWTAGREFAPADGATFDSFAYAMTGDSTHIVIGAPDKAGYAGMVYVLP